MQAAFRQIQRNTTRERIGIVYKAAILIYLLAVVVMSYQEGMTAFAKGAGLGLALLFVFRALASGERVFVPAEYRFLVAWLIVCIISSAFSAAPETALPRVLTLLQVFPIAFVISNLIVWNGDSRFYWLGLVFAAGTSGVITLLSPAQFMGLDGRLFGTLGNANAFAALLAVSVAICLAVFMGVRALVVRAVCLVLAAFFLYLVGRTGSRMGMLASLVAVITIAVCFQVSRKGKGLGVSLAILIFGGLIVAGSIVYLSSSEFSDRLVALTTSAQKGDFRAAGDMSLYNRARLYKKALELTLEHPLLGVGLDVFRTAGLEFHTIGNNSHSNYMEILASTGFIGAPLYFAMYYCWWSRLLKARVLLQDARYASRFAMAAAIAGLVLVLDIAWVTYYEKLVWLVLAGLIAESNLLSRAARSSHV